MPNIATVLKDEIRRLSRREIRATVGPLRKRLSEVRQLAAELKKKVASLEEASQRLLGEADARALQVARTVRGDAKVSRIGPRSIRSQRKRFGLTRDEFGLLVGVSANSVYLWESGKAAPRGKSRSALIGLRKIGAREAKRLVTAADG